MKNIYLFKNPVVEIKKPTDAVLEKWISDCYESIQLTSEIFHKDWLKNIKITKELMLQAYYFDCAFIIGRSDNAQEVIDCSYLNKERNIKEFLYQPSQSRLFNAICYILFGVKRPQCGDPDEFIEKYDSYVKNYKIDILNSPLSSQQMVDKLNPISPSLPAVASDAHNFQFAFYKID